MSSYLEFIEVKPILLETLVICVSTGKVGLFATNSKRTSDVFGPTLGSVKRILLELFKIKGVNKPISILKVKIPRKSTSEKHYHKEVTEIFYIVEGDGSIEAGGEVKRFRSGDLIIVEPGETHALTARETLTLVVIKIPDVAGDRWK